MLNLANFDGFLFDMDGTLLDSTACIEGIWRRWALDIGLNPDWVLHHVHGHRGVETIALVAPHLNAADVVRTLLDDELRSLEGTKAIAGAAALLEFLVATQQKWGVVTSAPREVALAKLHYVGLPVAPILIAAEDVSFGKPHAEPYLRGIAALGLQPSARVLAIEDAPAGIQSARAAGLAVLALRTSHADRLLGTADWIINDFTDLALPQALDFSVC